VVCSALVSEMNRIRESRVEDMGIAESGGPVWTVVRASSIFGSHSEPRKPPRSILDRVIAIEYSP
jgi:hypothetical protein